MNVEGHCSVCDGAHPTGYCTENHAKKMAIGFSRLLERLTFLKESPPSTVASKKEVDIENLKDSIPKEKVKFLMRLRNIDSSLVSVEDIEKTIIESPDPWVLNDTRVIIDLVFVHIDLIILKENYEEAIEMFFKMLKVFPEEKGKAIPMYLAILAKEEVPTAIEEQYKKLAQESDVSPDRLEALEQMILEQQQKPKHERIASVSYYLASLITGIKKRISTQLSDDLTEFARGYIPEFDPTMKNPAQHKEGGTKTKKFIKKTKNPIGRVQTVVPVLLREGRTEEAYSIINDALVMYPDNQILLRLQLKLDLQGNDKSRAIATLEKLRVAISDPGAIASLERKIQETFKHPILDVIKNKTKKPATERTENYISPAEIEGLLADPNKYQEGRNLLHDALIKNPKSIILLKLGFKIGIKERDKTAARAFLNELRALVKNYDMYHAMEGEFERKFPLEAGYRSSFVLDRFGSMTPVNSLAGRVTGWEDSGASIPSRPKPTISKRSVRTSLQIEPPHEEPHIPSRRKEKEATQETRPIARKEVDLNNASRRLSDLFNQEKKKKDGFIHAYKLEQAFMNLSNFIEDTDFGKRLSNRYSEKTFKGESTNFEALFEILSDEGVLYTIGQHPAGVFESVWYVNEPAYLKIKESLADKIRDIGNYPADQKRTTDIVANYFGINSEELLASQTTKSENPNMLYYRQILSYLVYELTAWSPSKTRVIPKQEIWEDKKERVTRDKRRIEELLTKGDKETTKDVSTLKKLVCAYG